MKKKKNKKKNIKKTEKKKKTRQKIFPLKNIYLINKMVGLLFG